MNQKSAHSQSSSLLTPKTALNDYLLCFESRQASLVGRREVLNGRAKFGIFGDGKELAQAALAHYFKAGDWRSGYYRDQTLIFALGNLSLTQYFAQLYADSSKTREPSSSGRQMNNHFSSHFIDENGQWMKQTNLKNISSDISPTGGQMARLLGLAYASKLYREETKLVDWQGAKNFSLTGNEIAFGTIGNASTSEGIFWESLNAAGVLQVPLLLCIWDDDFGISVPNEYQSTKGSIWPLLQGFQTENQKLGISLFQVKGYDYSKLLSTFKQAEIICRKQHSPCVVHVTHMTQPQGHSTSGSHERYKTKERLSYEEEIDCLKVMRKLILQEKFCNEEKLIKLEKKASDKVEDACKKAWNSLQAELQNEKELINQKIAHLNKISKINSDGLIFPETKNSSSTSSRKENKANILHSLINSRYEDPKKKLALIDTYQEYKNKYQKIYSDHLLEKSSKEMSRLPAVAAEYSSHSKKVDGRVVIQKFFAQKLAEDPRVFLIGEDIGKLGGVNLEFENLQETFGKLRVSDTGIREASILGQAFGAAMRGLRPIADIQYLDYLIYALQGLSDDVATLRYRTAGGQAAPLIIRTKGHRLEGIWHTGSPMGMLLGSLRGVHICVPRNCVQAAGLYQTLFQLNDPSLMIEVLNAYRIKELCPENLGEFKIPLGLCEKLHSGSDLTVVSYGANIRLVQETIPQLKKLDIHIDLIDVQTLLPFDLHHLISKSIEKTHAVLFLDEDVPGGASAFMLQKVLEEQKAFDFLELPPKTLSAKEHRSAYGSDGDYFSKPNKEDILLACYEIMRERNPSKYPSYLLN